jgi:hypothetical protein
MDKSYGEKCDDPRWHEVSSQVKERDGYICQECGSTKRLQAHHMYYEATKEPWEYKLPAMITLCATCHDKETHQRKYKENFLLSAMRRHFLGPQFESLACAFRDMPTDIGRHQVCDALAWLIRDPHYLRVLIDTYRKSH